MTREQFLDGMESWNSHLVLLWHALDSTKGDVVELGIGDGSTKKLHDYCQYNLRNLFSYENNLEWYRKFEKMRAANHTIDFTNHWMEPIERHREPIGVLFSDESPGELRKYNIAMFCNTAQIIVAHDSEPEAEGGYKFSLVKPLFKYIKHFEYPGAHATAFSNFIDVSKWDI